MRPFNSRRWPHKSTHRFSAVAGEATRFALPFDPGADLLPGLATLGDRPVDVYARLDPAA